MSQRYPQRALQGRSKAQRSDLRPMFYFLSAEKSESYSALALFQSTAREQRMDEILIPAPTWGPAPFLPAADSDWGLGSSRARLPGSPAWENLWLAGAPAAQQMGVQCTALWDCARGG